MRRIRSTLTFANVMSVTAVFIALGGSALAITVSRNSVSSKSIKNESIKGIDVADESLTGQQVNEGTLQLPVGPQGPKGDTGPAGSIAGTTAAGDLAGTYPGPTIKNDAVTGAKVAADTLGGADINESSLSGVLKTADVQAFGTGAAGSVNVVTNQEGSISKQFTAPAAGLVLVTTSINAQAFSPADGRLQYWTTLDGTSFQCNIQALDLENVVGATESGSDTAVIPVTAGSHTVALNWKGLAGTTVLFGRKISILYVPTGSGQPTISVC